MLSRKTRLGIWTVVLLTTTVAIVNLLSAVTPSLSPRVSELKEIFPFEIRASGHIFAGLSGFFLLILANNLLRLFPSRYPLSYQL